MNKSLSVATVLGSFLLLSPAARATCGPLTGFVPGTDVGFLATGPISLMARAAECFVSAPSPIVPVTPVTPVAPILPTAPAPLPAEMSKAVIATGSNYDTALLTGIWQGLVIAEVGFIAYQVITGENRPPVGSHQLTCDAWLAPVSGKLYHVPKNRLAQLPPECVDKAEKLPEGRPLIDVKRPSAVDEKGPTPIHRKQPKVKRLPKKG
jgi:hypothetical protein